MNNSVLPTAHLTPETLGAMIKLYIGDIVESQYFPDSPDPEAWDCPIMGAYKEIQSGKASLEKILHDFRVVYES